MRAASSRLAISAAVLLGFLCTSAGALEWTGATLFLCEGDGAVIAAGRWNSGPVDAAWDLFFHEGPPAEPGSGGAGGLRWLNAEGDHSLRVPLQPGTATFTFRFESNSDIPRVGLNLFLDGTNERPAISAFAATASGGPPWPEVKPNSAATMSLPIAEAPGAGTLTWAAGEGGLWTGAESSARTRVTLKELRVVAPPATGGLDLVGPHAVGPSGRADWVGVITLLVEDYVPRPPELLLWLQTETGLTVGEPDRSAEWRKTFRRSDVVAPFSFVYGGASSRDFLRDWSVERSERKVDENRTACTLRYTDPRTGLVVRWEGLEYRDAKTIEWTLWFEAGETETPVLSDIRALDATLSRRPGEEYLLRHWKGTFVRRNDYEPLQTVLGPSASLGFSPPGGRPCGWVFPYYNLETPGEGLILVVSWAGQWAARFERDADRGLNVVAGQETTRLKLLPGEKIRTPLIVVQPWKGGDWIDAQNAWRRWMIRYNLPRPGGKLPPLPQLAACSSHQFAEMIHANEENQKLFVDRYLEEGLKLDYWWMDAGWYVNQWGWPHTGTWEVDRKRFPNGLRAISDHARAKGVKTIVWFEPERVAGDTWLTRTHPEWIIGGAGGGLLDLGIPEARKWLTDHVDGLITSEGIDLYRQDYNIDPLGHWRQKDGPDREGITENLYVQGYLSYWDELRRRHPDMLIDSCASGGHRNDLETMRRSVPLLRSDYLFEPVGQQGHTFGLASWLPFFGTAVSPPRTYDPYTYRSHMCPHNTGCFDVRDPTLDYDLIRRLDGEWRRIAPYWFGEYYPLTPYSLSEDDWLAWQFHDPAKGEGAVQAFRRTRSMFFGAQFRLRGLDPETRYEVMNLDAPESCVQTGRELMDAGLRVELAERPGAAVIVYKKG